MQLFGFLEIFFFDFFEGGLLRQAESIIEVAKLGKGVAELGVEEAKFEGSYGVASHIISFTNKLAAILPNNYIWFVIGKIY